MNEATTAKKIPSNGIQEDEYLDESSGLLYCKKCQTPRQSQTEINGEIRYPRALCRCRAETRNRQAEERKAEAIRDRISRFRSIGLTDPVMREYTFTNDLGYNPRQMEMAKVYVENWEDMLRDSAGIYFWGDVGTGKTFIAGCIANALLDKGVPVMMTNFTRLLNRLTDMYSGDRNAYIDSLNAYPLLIIDDLGIERNSEFSREQVFNIIDSRYRSQRPMIITTNLTPEYMKNQPDMAQRRIHDRVLERCVPVLVNDQNIRDRNASAHLAQMKALLQEVNNDRDR